MKRLDGVIAADRDLEQVGPAHPFHHVGLKGDSRPAAGLDGRRTYDRPEGSTAFQHRDLDVLDAEWSIADVCEVKGVGDRLVEGHLAQVHTLNGEVEPGAALEGLSP